MSPMRKGLVVAAIHVAIVGSLGAKLLVDRATRPRVWAHAAPYDPNQPIRGRYVRIQIEAAIGPGLEVPGPTDQIARNGIRAVWDGPIALSARDGQLVALPPSGSNTLSARPALRQGQRVVVLSEPLAYFIPEHASDPSRRLPGEELWVEVTLPRRGLPRPIRLGVKKDGVLTPLEVR